MEGQQQEKKPTLAIFEFEWDLTNTAKKTGTILSKMIEFRGEKLFRAGLKNQVQVSHLYNQESSTLLLMVTDLAKMGLRANNVLYSKSGPMTKKMDELCNGAEDKKVQIFTAQAGCAIATGKESYKFRVYITGVVENFQFNQKDSLLNDQLWLSAKNKVGTDFEITAGKEVFSVHKFMLAARSPVFAVQFSKEKKEKCYFDDSDCMEEFLKFVYTGQLEKAITNPKKLKELATTYDIKTLASICETASQEMDRDQMSNFVLQFEPLVGNCSVEIR